MPASWLQQLIFLGSWGKKSNLPTIECDYVNQTKVNNTSCICKYINTTNIHLNMKDIWQPLVWLPYPSHLVKYIQTYQSLLMMASVRGGHLQTWFRRSPSLTGEVGWVFGSCSKASKVGCIHLELIDCSLCQALYLSMIILLLLLWYTIIQKKGNLTVAGVPHLDDMKECHSGFHSSMNDCLC